MSVISIFQQTDKKKAIIAFAGLLVALVVLAFVMSRGGVAVASIILLLPFGVIFMVASFNKPVVALYVLFIFSFFLVAIDRYILKEAFPIGTVVDFLLAFSYIMLIFKGVIHKVEWKKAGEGPIGIMSIWIIYCVLEILNPEAPGAHAWFVGIRPFLYMALSIPLFCMFLTVRSIKVFLILWGTLSFVLTLKGMMQLVIGLDSVEQVLLTVRSFANTHLLWGKLRVFSICSDAGQFGACQAHAGLVGGILFLSAKKLPNKIFYFVMCVTGALGMFISGTRGSLFVVVAGLLVYLVLIKNVRLFILGLICGGTAFGLLALTEIGQSVYEIRRMRTALTPSLDPSYQVRVQKNERMKAYLATRPFGGGLGSMADSGTGIKGSFLGSTWSDSGYVHIWGQTGVVGLCIYITMIVFILLKGSYLVWFKIKNEWLRSKVIAVVCGISGIAVAHYGNPVMTMHPTCLVFFFSVALIFISPRLDKELTQEEPEISASTSIVKR